MFSFKLIEITSIEFKFKSYSEWVHVTRESRMLFTIIARISLRLLFIYQINSDSSAKWKYSFTVALG